MDILLLIELGNGHQERIKCESMEEARGLRAEATSVGLECEVIITND